MTTRNKLKVFDSFFWFFLVLQSVLCGTVESQMEEYFIARKSFSSFLSHGRRVGLGRGAGVLGKMGEKKKSQGCIK